MNIIHDIDITYDIDIIRDIRIIGVLLCSLVLFQKVHHELLLLVVFCCQILFRL